MEDGDFDLALDDADLDVIARVFRPSVSTCVDIVSYLNQHNPRSRGTQQHSVQFHLVTPC